MNVLDYFKKSRLKIKLLFLALLPVALMLSVLVAIVLYIHQANARIGTLYSDRIVPLQQIKQVSDAYAVDLVDTSNKLLAGALTADLALAQLSVSEKVATQAWQDYLHTQLTVEEVSLVQQAESRLRTARALLQKISHAIQNKNQQLLQQIVSQQLYPTVEALSQSLHSLSAIQLTEAKAIYEANQQTLFRVYLFSGCLLLLVILLSVVLIRILSGFTLQSISKATRSTAALFSPAVVDNESDNGYVPEAKSHLLETIENIRQQLGFSIEETMRLLSAIPAPVVAVWDPKGKVSNVNYAFERQFSIAREYVIGKQLEALPLWPENEATQAIQQHLKAAREGSSAVFHIQLEINQGQWGSRLFFVTVSSWRQRKQPVTLMLFEDVTAWHKRELWLNNKIARDPLTNLLNRDGFNQVIGDLWFRWKTYEEPFALVMADLNDFKAVNDNYGHLAGDQVLQQFASSLEQHVRKTDLCIRWGGDEFAIILIDCQSLQAAQLQLARIQDSLQQKGIAPHDNQQISASFGCVHVSEQTASPLASIDELLQLADARMYTAKRRNKQPV